MEARLIPAERTAQCSPVGMLAEPLEPRRMLTSPFWLSGAATYDSLTNIATVTGSAQIVADPGSVEPIVEASGSSASVEISPGDDIFVHLGGLSLSNGATAKVDSVPGGGTEQNHYVVVIGAPDATSAPAFSIDTTNGSQLNLADNDLIVHDGASLLSTIQGYLGEGTSSDPTASANGDSSTDALYSSAAVANSTAAVAAGGWPDQYVLGAGLNSDLASPYNSWTVGPVSEPLQSGDLLVKYTINGDFNLDGTVNSTDRSILAANSGNPGDFIDGDANGDGTIEGTGSGANTGADLAIYKGRTERDANV